MVPLTEMTGLSPAMQVAAKDMTARAVAQLDPYVQDLNTPLDLLLKVSCAHLAQRVLLNSLLPALQH